MVCTSKAVRFNGAEIQEFEPVQAKITCKGVQLYSTEAEKRYMAEFDTDLLERKDQRNLTPRAHLLLALGRAAELRFSVEACMTREAALLFANEDKCVSAPRCGLRSSLRPTLRAPPLPDPVPRFRQRSASVDSTNSRRIPAVLAASVPGVTTPRSNSRAIVVQRPGDSSSEVRAEAVEAQSDKSTRARGDSMADDDNVLISRKRSELRRHCRYLTTQTLPEPALKVRPPVCVKRPPRTNMAGPRAPRKYLLAAASQAWIEAVAESEQATNLQMSCSKTSAASQPQPSYLLESADAGKCDDGYVGTSGVMPAFERHVQACRFVRRLSI
eukprot:TRINITY_DN71829_c0_g1_i1.p1 TRINITY_DN71829_c0_g1~~TRINITY_DN71829_c0_g1_i1.p1  ORF type:complete len:335 (-),score=33.51 TRINITY_DN71829_c0_g1_i1:392-1375(-)